MEDIRVLGTREVLGKKVKVIEGGFGDGQKCMLASDIAKQHTVETREINQLIDRNKNRFSANDLIDLCCDDFKITASDLGLIVSNNQKHCYVLSERGYTKLVSMMSNSNDKKWEVMDIIIDEYFTMREVIKATNHQADLFTQLMSASMTAISQVLNDNMIQLRQDMKDEFNREKQQMKGIITEQELVHKEQMQEARSLIGFKTKNTASLTKLLKAKIGSIKGYTISAKDDYHYISIREKLFKKYGVWNWEEIPVFRYDEVHADIDSIEDLEDVNF